MFQYLIALFFISTYSYSLGVPLQDTLLAHQLYTLSNHCKSSFISTQIQAKQAECSIESTQLSEKKIQCLLFYDINKQLCDAIAASKLSLPDDNSSLINEAIDVEDTCKLAFYWNFTDLAQFPTYRENMLKVFHVKLGCLKVCSVPEVTSTDTNFFCKYFKWGSEKLNSSMLKVHSDANIKLSNLTVTLTAGTTNNVEASADAVNNNLSVSSSAAAVIENTLKSNASLPSIAGNKSSGPTQLEESKLDLPTSDKTSPLDKQKGETDGHVATHSITIPKDKTNNPEKPILSPEVVVTNALDKPSAAGIEASNHEDVAISKTSQTKSKETTHKLKVASNQDQPEPDYNDSEEVKEGLVDGDDNETGDDPNIGGELEPKPVKTQTQNAKTVDNTMSFVGEREFFPMQEQYKTDDDHFFPFFLTGIILVVLLYVLYHNMSKVSRVFLGLIVEGRQPGRRRNSRGHAYRRLDTLEQAMSTNSAAPPSKIIY